MQAERFIRLFHLVVIWLVTVAVAAGAEPWTIRGTVVDENDNPVKGAIVKIENKARLYIRSYITQEDGSFHFSGLNRNIDYSVRARKNKQWSSRTYLSRFRSRDEPTITLRLRSRSSLLQLRRSSSHARVGHLSHEINLATSIAGATGFALYPAMATRMSGPR
jgi:hypothetical protein